MAVLDRTRKVSEYNQGGHLRFIKSSLKFLRFSLRQNTLVFCLVRADSFVGAAGGGAALEQARPKAELIK